MAVPIDMRNVKKSFGDTLAVDGVTLQVQQDEIFGLIGPDGAGKTTIIRILVSLLNADEGEVLFQGSEVRQHPGFVRSRIGYMPQRFSLYRDLSVQQNLRFFADLFKIPRHLQGQRMEMLYNFSKLSPFRDRLAGALSGGMKQKLALSCMLMHEPEVLVLDEPTFGVDPVSRNEFWDILNTLCRRHTSILVTTAYMDEATLCHRIGLIHQGRLLATDTPQALLDTFEHPLYRIRTSTPHLVFGRLASSQFEGQIQLFGDGVHFIDRRRIGRSALAAQLQSLAIPHDGIAMIKPTLENLFLEMM